jgi:hypothetical protein
MPETDFREYTIREAGKSLTTIEVHLKQTKDDAVYCNECTQKHFLEVQKFAEEGAGFFPENKDWWENLETEARNDARALTLAKKDQGRFSQLAIEVGGRVRKRRKELIVMLEDEIIRQAEREPQAALGGEKAYLVGHAGRRADLGAMNPDDMTEDQAHDYLMGLVGIDVANLKGEKAYLVGHAGRRDDLGCLFGCPGSANLGANPAGGPGTEKAALAKAKKEGCTCMILGDDPESKICWAKGWIGALNKEQRESACTDKNTTVKKAKKTSGIGRVVEKFRKANQRCRDNANASVRPGAPDRTVQVFAHYTGCMSKALLKKGKIPKKAKPATELPPSKTPQVAPGEGPRAGRQVSVSL